MPIRYITVPATVVFKNPFKDEVLKGPSGEEEKMSFGDFLEKLMHNPMWGEHYHNTKAQNEIMEAWEKCKASKEEPQIMLLGEEDWQKLKQSAEHPKFEVITAQGTQTRAGYGVHSTLSRQLLPLVAAIMEAPTADPRVKAKA